jgi:hypothetical protein
MTNPVNALRQMSMPPTEEASFNTWLQLADAIAFLKENIRDDQFVLYANLPNAYMHAMLVPSECLAPPNVNDLMSWNCSAYSGWAWLLLFIRHLLLLYRRLFDEARKIVSPLRTLHALRSKLKGHAVGQSTQTQLRQQALNEHGSYKEHFRVLCRACDESLRKITETIAARRASPSSPDKQ